MGEKSNNVLVNIGRYAWEDASESWLRDEGIRQRADEIESRKRGETFHITLPLALAEDLMDHCALLGWGSPGTEMDLQKRYRRAAETIKFQLATQTGKNYGSLKRKHVAYARLERRSSGA